MVLTGFVAAVSLVRRSLEVCFKTQEEKGLTWPRGHSFWPLFTHPFLHPLLHLVAMLLCSVSVACRLVDWLC